MPLSNLTFESIYYRLISDSGLVTAANSFVTTTGGITAGTAVLTVASATSFSAGHGLTIAEAGTGGGKLVTWIASIDGLDFTLYDKAVNTVVAKAVEHDDRAVVPARNILATYGNLPVRLPAIDIAQSGAIGNDFPDSDRGEITFYVYHQSEPGSAGEPNTVLSLIAARVRDLMHRNEDNIANSGIRTQIMMEVNRSPIMTEPDISETTHFQALRYEYLVNR